MTTNNTPTPTATININGRDLTLTFDFNAMAIVQEETGRNPFGEEIWDDLGPIETIALLYGFLNSAHPDITKEWLRKNIHMGNMTSVIESMQTAWLESIPEQPAEENASDQSGEKKTEQN